MKHHFSKKFFFRRLLFILAGIAVISLVVMFLWNWLMPVIFHVPAVNYLQALGLLVLSKILLFGPGRYGHRPNFKDREFWKKKFEEMHNTKGMAHGEGNAE